ncbi:MAG: type II toxin-antitoxin system RelE/ParE family toxin [Nitrospirae bacterium]|nr:type II toxin-antitoxin system RelE/ParE family toxin [Nitrospirota bacterium]
MFKFEVEFYEEEPNPVIEFIENLPKKANVKAYKYIALLEEKGPEMLSSYCTKLSHHPKLWELKIDYRTNAYRIFFFRNEKTIILLHGIAKKTNSTPIDALNLSEKRMKKWLEGKGIKK